MGITMNEKKLKALANELAKDLKTPNDLSARDMSSAFEEMYGM